MSLNVRDLFDHLFDIAALIRSHMNGLQPFESTIEQTTETMPPSHKTITLSASVMMTKVYKSCYTTVCLIIMMNVHVNFALPTWLKLANQSKSVP